MMGTKSFKIDAPWAEQLKKTRVSFLMNPSSKCIEVRDKKRQEDKKTCGLCPADNGQLNILGK